LKQIGLATQQYVALHRVFPANWGLPDFYHNRGGPLSGDMKEYSVFALLLPHLDEVSLYQSINFDHGIVDPYYKPGAFGSGGLAANRTAMSVTLGFLLCPSDGASHTQRTGATNYRANNGTERWYISHDGPFMSEGGRQNSPAAIRDGLSTTVAFSEKLRGHSDSGRLDPRTDMVIGGLGLPYSVDESLQSCASQPGASEGFLTYSGFTWFVGSLAQTNYNHILEPNSAVPDCVLPGSATVNGLVSARSNHHGGVHVAMCDGSVRFVTQTLRRAVWRALGSRAGGEAISSDEF
jgi:hypothetical protein